MLNLISRGFDPIDLPLESYSINSTGGRHHLKSTQIRKPGIAGFRVFC
jgi:hypothetical protein